MFRSIRALPAIVLLLVIFAQTKSVAGNETVSMPSVGSPSESSIIDLMRRACDYQIEQQKKSQDNNWIRATFYTGLMQTWRTTQDKKYLDQALKWGELHQFTPPAGRHADHQCCIQTYAELFLEHEQDQKFIYASRRLFDEMMASPQRGREEWWWCDALYMAPPALARMAKATGDRRYLVYMDEMWWDAYEFLFSKEHSLFYRDKSFFDQKAANGKPIFWSRGNGWVMGGTVRVLQYLPEDFSSRGRYIELFQTMAGKVATLQGEDGLWRASLLDAEQFPLPETSGSAFFTYALAWGINNNVLDREKFLPVVERAWKGLASKVTPEGRLTHVQQVGASPEAFSPESTHEYGVGAFLLAAAEVLQLAPGGAEGDNSNAVPKTVRIDFGAGPVEKEYAGVDLRQPYDAKLGYGWTSALDDATMRDRKAPDALRQDYVFGKSAQTFRVDVIPGTTYNITLIMGDMEFGNHVLQPAVDVEGVKLPTLGAEAAEFATLTFGVKALENQSNLNFTFGSPVDNWVINALTIEPAPGGNIAPPKIEKRRFPMPKPRDTWSAETTKSPDPIAPFMKQFRDDLNKGDRKLAETGIQREAYLKLIAGNVDYFKQHQNAEGAIIDPHRKAEFQYSTPCFAYAAAALVAHAGRDDLLEPAAKAFDWASSALARSDGANNHDDFYPPPLARAYPLLKDRVAPERAKKWADDLSVMDPYKTYSYPPGANNWNIVALTGEFLFHTLGFRETLTYVEESVRAQGRHFSPWGMYTEGPMAYDHFPRLWAADLIASGYSGARSAELAESLRRAALTSLFMQSPTGELPTGGRSAHHQWNEAEQIVTYEIYAAKALTDGDEQLAGVFKRAAHLAFQSMQRWQRGSGEMWIVKNKFEPGKLHGYETYSAHSQYNLLPMAMLAIAFDHAEKTEAVKEVATPAEVGGFVLDLRPTFHKVFANAGGMYVEIDTTGDMEHNPTGFLRSHQTGFNPQLGPSDGVSARTVEQYPEKPTETAAIGVAWQDTTGNWRRLADFGAKDLSRVELLDVHTAPDHVKFQIIYQGYFSGPNFISERYVITPDRVEVTTELPNYDGPAQLVWPVLSEQSEAIKTTIDVNDKTVSVSLDGDTQTFTVPGAEKVSVSDVRQPHRNGYVRIATAAFPAGTKKLTLVIEPKPKK